MKKTKNTYTIYLVPHTHYDAVWVFTKEDYFYININLILKKAVELIEKTDFRFLIEQTYLLERIEKTNPVLFSKIKRLVKEGKIEIADGEYLMADTMLPYGETLIREIFFGKRYIKERFGIEVPVMWGADSFGYNAQCPQIYKKSGYKYFAFRRGAGKDRPSEFWWKGLDGTKILSHWMPKGYRAGLDVDKIEENFQLLKKLSATSNILMPAGSGVTMPQPEIIGFVKKWNKTHQDVKIKFASSLDFFRRVEKQSKYLKTYKGELYSGRFSKVFPNTASSRIWIKQGLRESENLMLITERWLAIAWVSNLVNYYPQRELNLYWKKILFTAFHDVAPGTGIDACYKEVRQTFNFLKSKLLVHLYNSLSAFSRNLKEQADVCVFNSLSWPVKDWTEAELNFKKGEIKDIKGLRSGKEEIEVEVLESVRYPDSSLKKARIGFIASVPALGYKAYEILQRPPKIGAKNPLRVNGETVENRFFKTKLDRASGLIDIFYNKKWLAKANEIVLEEETGDLYYHQENIGKFLKTERGRGVKYGSFKIERIKSKKTSLRQIFEIDAGYYSLRWPYRLTEKLKPLLWRHKYISFRKKIIIYRDLDRIDFVTQIKNRHPQIRIRVRFSTDISSSRYECGSQFGRVKRPVNQYYSGSNKWKEKPNGIYPSINWIDYSDKERGLTVLNKGIPANEIRDRDIYLTLLRSVNRVSDGRGGPVIPVFDAAEFKDYTFNYSVLPHGRKDKEYGPFKSGFEFNQGLTAVPVSFKKSSKNKSCLFPSQFSFVEIKPDSLILTSFKKVDGQEAVILRFFESKGERTAAEINLFKEPRRVEITNLLEEPEKDIDFGGKKIKLKVGPFEIVSLKLYF